MKFLNFIKNNISVFSFLAIISFFYLILVNPNDEDNGCAQGWVFFGKIIFTLLSLLLISMDFLMKNMILNRYKLNIIQIVVLLILGFYIYNL